ncbi:MAG: DUF992 domain-containing protein [Alphaproteobacteria bacterium]
MKYVIPAVFALIFLYAPAVAQNVNSGMLTCHVDAGVGLVLGSNKSMTCNYRPGDNAKPIQYYTGTLKKVGLDIGFTNKAVISWVVLASTRNIATGDLAGVYSGASAEASVGVGLGANALIGGNANSFVLQPFSGQTQTGLNLAVGIASLELRQQ